MAIIGRREYGSWDRRFDVVDDGVKHWAVRDLDSDIILKGGLQRHEAEQLIDRLLNDTRTPEEIIEEEGIEVSGPVEVDTTNGVVRPPQEEDA